MDDRELVRVGYRYAISLSHSPVDAEDLVQAACAKLLASRGEIGEKALLFVTIRNLFYDDRRRAKVVSFQTLDSEPSAPDGGFEARRDLDRLLARLRPAEREAIYLNAVEGFTAEEIARLSGRSRNTILSWLSRARKKLEAAVAAERTTHPMKGGRS